MHHHISSALRYGTAQGFTPTWMYYQQQDDQWTVSSPPTVINLMDLLFRRCSTIPVWMSPVFLDIGWTVIMTHLNQIAHQSGTSGNMEWTLFPTRVLTIRCNTHSSTSESTFYVTLEFMQSSCWWNTGTCTAQQQGALTCLWNLHLHISEHRPQHENANSSNAEKLM